MDSNVGTLKNKIAQLRRLVADLRGELVEVLTCQNDMERSFGEQLDRHREDLNWDCQECYKNSTLFAQFLSYPHNLWIVILFSSPLLC